MTRGGHGNVASALSDPDRVWELYHENSKHTRLSALRAAEQVVEFVKLLWDSLPYAGHRSIVLPPAAPVGMPLGEAIRSRHSTREFLPGSLSLLDLSTLLHGTYGTNQDRPYGVMPRPFRVAPSAGALYPLELYFCGFGIEDLGDGLFHYQPESHAVHVLREGDVREEVAAGFAQPDIARAAPLLVFVTAVFERVVFKYGDRGYRYALIEAGHAVQNFNLVATALGLGSVNLAGYYDRIVDEWLGIDGLSQSTLYCVAAGRAGRPTGAAGIPPSSL
jgi:SagB-type dehydrogenase family enzyme